MAYRYMEYADVNRVRHESALIRNENEVLRCHLRNLKLNPYGEVRKVLMGLLMLCSPTSKRPEKCPTQQEIQDLCRALQENQERFDNDEEVGEQNEDDQSCGGQSCGQSSSKCGQNQENDKNNCMIECIQSRCPSSKHGAGCSKGMCGGYTPSGWNKAEVRQHMDQYETGCPTRAFPKSPCTPHNGLASPRCHSCEGGGARQRQRTVCEEGDDQSSNGCGKDAIQMQPERGGGQKMPLPMLPGNCSSGVYDCKNRPSVRILGELAFQLERRILEYVFGAEGKYKRRFYGYTVGNICYMMAKENTNPNGKQDVIGKSDKAFRFQKLMGILAKYGYHVKKHPSFSQDIINKDGVLACTPDPCIVQVLRLQEVKYVSDLISKLSGSPWEVANLNILLKCLAYMSRCDGKPLFIF